MIQNIHWSKFLVILVHRLFTEQVVHKYFSGCFCVSLPRCFRISPLPFALYYIVHVHKFKNFMTGKRENLNGFMGCLLRFALNNKNNNINRQNTTFPWQNRSLSWGMYLRHSLIAEGKFFPQTLKNICTLLFIKVPSPKHDLWCSWWCCEKTNLLAVGYVQLQVHSPEHNAYQMLTVQHRLPRFVHLYIPPRFSYCFMT